MQIPRGHLNLKIHSYWKSTNPKWYHFYYVFPGLIMNILISNVQKIPGNEH